MKITGSFYARFFWNTDLPGRKPEYESSYASKYWYESDGLFRESDHYNKVGDSFFEKTDMQLCFTEEEFYAYCVANKPLKISKGCYTIGPESIQDIFYDDWQDGNTKHIQAKVNCLNCNKKPKTEIFVYAEIIDGKYIVTVDKIQPMYAPYSKMRQMYTIEEDHPGAGILKQFNALSNDAYFVVFDKCYKKSEFELCEGKIVLPSHKNHCISEVNFYVASEINTDEIRAYFLLKKQPKQAKNTDL